MYQEGIPQDKDSTIRDLTSRVEQLTLDNQSKDQQLRHLNQLLQAKDETIAALQQQLQSGGSDTRAAPNLQGAQVTQARQQAKDLIWETLPDIPVEMSASSTAVIGDKAYFLSIGCKNVYEFDMQRKHWTALPKHPIANGFAIVSINDTLTSVGGYIDSLLGSNYSNKLYSFLGNKWAEQLPPMPTKRSIPSAIYANNILVVAGGLKGLTPIIMVEVLNTRSRQWSSASSLPFALSKHSGAMAICGDYVYMATSLVTTELGKNVLYRCSLSALAQSKPKATVWKQIDDQMTPFSTMAIVDGQLLAIGGRDTRHVASREVLRFNISTNAWEVVGHMTVPRSDCLVAVLPRNKLMVVGAFELNFRRMATVTTL